MPSMAGKYNSFLILMPLLHASIVSQYMDHSLGSFQWKKIEYININMVDKELGMLKNMVYIYIL